MKAVSSQPSPTSTARSVSASAVLHLARARRSPYSSHLLLSRLYAVLLTHSPRRFFGFAVDPKTASRVVLRAIRSSSSENVVRERSSYVRLALLL